jgi:predicted DNA-binding protein (UPF0251 family)
MKKIIDCTTGEVIERPFNADELAQQEIDEAAYQAAEAIRLAEAEAKAQAKAAAEAKLSALGLTTDDLRALGL